MWKIVTAAAAVVAGTAIAQASTDSSTRRAPNTDPNQIVCVTVHETGSRVRAHRVCRTRAEWAEHQAEQRRTVERTQMFKVSCDQKQACMPQGNTAAGRR
jgi:hypothetical protein